MSRAPTSLYESMEVFYRKAGLMKESSLRAGPGTKKLATQIAETRITFEDIILDILNQLYVQAMSLDVTTRVMRSVEHQGKRESSLDLLDSLHLRILRLCG